MFISAYSRLSTYNSILRSVDLKCGCAIANNSGKCLSANGYIGVDTELIALPTKKFSNSLVLVKCDCLLYECMDPSSQMSALIPVYSLVNDLNTYSTVLPNVPGTKNMYIIDQRTRRLSWSHMSLANLPCMCLLNCW